MPRPLTAWSAAVAFAAMAMLAAAAPGTAQAGAQGRSRSGGAQSLTQEQRRKIADIRQRAAQKRREIAREVREDVSRLLTPAQRERWQRAARAQMQADGYRARARAARGRAGWQARRAEHAARLRGLDLTAEQRDRLRAIWRERANAMREEAMRVLTPDQRRRFEEMQNRRRAR